MKTCGNCPYARFPEGYVKGRCYGAPPVPTPSGYTLRAEVTVKDPGCHLHPGESQPMVLTKVNPETPAHAARAARRLKP